MVTNQEQQALDLLKNELDNQIHQENRLLEKRDLFVRTIRHHTRDMLLELLPAHITNGRQAEKGLVGMDETALRKKLIGLYCEELGLEKQTRHIKRLKIVIESLEMLAKEE